MMVCKTMGQRYAKTIRRRRPRGDMAKRALIMAIVALTSSAAAAETVDQAYDRALKEYYAGKYSKAVASLERIRAVPLENEDLRYNLGCAYFRLGKLGPAIFHFERALAMDPSSEDAAFNIETSRALAASKVTDKLKGADREPVWMRAVGLLGTGTWTTMFLVLWWATFALILAIRFVHPGPLRAGLVVGAGFVAVISIVCATFLLGRVYVDRRVTLGIVLPDRLDVREGPNTSTKSTFKLHAGFKVRLQTRANGWIRIRLPNGLEGWVLRESIGVL